MPHTIDDNDYISSPDDHLVDASYEHEHFIGRSLYVSGHRADIDHGRPASRVYNRRGDWYAVHTH